MTISRLKAKLDKATVTKGVILDDAMSRDISDIMDDAEAAVMHKYPEGSFLRLFWKQQREAEARPGCGRRWHPMMLKWCIYLRHQSSKAYETLR